MDFEDPQVVKTEIERRRYRRVKLAAQVHCEALERREVMVTRDITVEGMFLNAKFPLPTDSELSLTFQLDPAAPPITCTAKVVFSRVGLGMGIKFLDLKPEAFETLQRFVVEAG